MTARKDLPPALWVVATPIGNLGDLSTRALAALESAAAIFCEDTRVCARLLNAYSIDARGRLKRLDAHAPPAQIEGALDLVKQLVDEGKGVAMVSDAGTPSVSDPGSALVAACHEADIAVMPIPGPSALAAFISVSGSSARTVSFRGFFPRKAKEREVELEAAKAAGGLQIWFESPERIASALAQLGPFAEQSGAPIVVAKELTKVHEHIWRGIYSTISIEATDSKSGDTGADSASLRGEWVIAIDFLQSARDLASRDGADAGKSLDWVKVLEMLIDAQVSASEAARRVSQVFGVSKKPVYEQALVLAGKKEIKKSHAGD